MTGGAGPAHRVYLDYNASAPLRPAARAAMTAVLAQSGNASSVHEEGRAARAVIERARADIAALLGAEPRAVVFTSGATEAANDLLSPSLGDAGGCADTLLVGASEHPCVIAGHRFAPDRVRVIPVDAAGRIDLDALAAALETIPGRALLALQAANNETGVIQPVAEAARLVHARGGLVACDAVQWAGRGDCRLETLAVDALFISSHKLGGPKGAGAIAFARAGLHIGQPLIRGGGQERGARGGTENTLAIVGFGAAAREAAATMETEYIRLARLRERLEERLRGELPELAIFGGKVARLPNTSAFALPDLTAETLLMALDMAGMAVSSGSACSSGKVRASHVLEAMGVEPALARGALRISFGWASSESDVDRFCETFQKTVRDIRARRASLAART